MVNENGNLKIKENIFVRFFIPIVITINDIARDYTSINNSLMCKTLLSVLAL